MYTFGELLKAFRSRAGLSQQELADSLGKSRNTIVNWEGGHYRPDDPDIITALIAALDLSESDTAELLASLVVEIPSEHEIEQKRDAIFRLAKALKHFSTLPLETVPLPTDLPVGSRMPLPRNSLFVGRDAPLLTLAHALKPKAEKPKVIAVTGFGGMGKTNLASEFVYRYGQYFVGGVFWLSFENASAIAGEISACATSPALNVAPDLLPLSVEDRAQAVLDQWGSAIPRLLIFDNCDDEALLMRWLPKTGGCRIIVTSRWTAWKKVLEIKVLELSVFQEFESIQLLKQYRPDIDIEEANAIAVELDHLPLALHLAGRFLKRYAHKTTVADYLGQLRQPNLLEHLSLQGHYQSKEHSPTFHDPNVARTFALSYALLDPEDRVDSLATVFLATAAWLAPGEIIPRELLLPFVVEQPQAMPAALIVEDALLRLLELGLLEGKVETAMRLHRLLAYFVRMDERILPIRDTVEAKMCAYLDEANALETPKRLSAWQIHARAVADAALLRQSSIRADLAVALGQHLYLSGDAEGAYYYLQYALKIRQELLGADHKATAVILNKLGLILQDLGKSSVAKTYYENALARFAHDDADRKGLIESLLASAQWFQGLSELKQAHTYFDQALRLQEEQVGRDHIEVAKIRSRLGFLLITKGDLDLAYQMLSRALLIQARDLPSNHLEIAQTMKYLGLLLTERGDLPEATHYFERALEIREEVLEPNHAFIAASMRDLGNVCIENNELPRARALIESASSILSAIRDPIHGSIILNFNSMGVLLYKEGNLEAARETLEEAIRLQVQVSQREQVQKISHHVARMNHDLGVILHAQAHYSDAEITFRKSLKTRLELFGTYHYKTAQSLAHLGISLYAQGKPDEARTLLHQALPIQQRVLGVAHPETVKSQATLDSIEGNLSVTP